MKSENEKALCTGPESTHRLNRREMLGRFAYGLGGMALAEILADPSARARAAASSSSGVLREFHHQPKVRRVISLFQSGGPSHLETFDYKPLLNKMQGQDLPASVRMGQRLTGMSGFQSQLPLVGSFTGFKQHGPGGTWISDVLPHTARIADKICVINSLHSEAINHDPAITFLQTGSQIAGRPSVGAWIDYGLGSENENLPTYVVLITKGQGDQPLYSRLWGSGFLPSRHQGVQFRASADAVLYLNNPPGVDASARRDMLDRLRQLHELEEAKTHDPDIQARIAQYEMAFRMQSSVPEATDLTKEPEYIYDMYGEDSRKPGTFAANCLMARRLAERGVRFIQLFHQGWDQHGGLPGGITAQCKKTDQASAALVLDLEQRGLLEDTLVVWGGEFGRTNYCQGKISPGNYGRDHHPRCFSAWMAGGGVKGGSTWGQTDEFGYNVVKDGVHVHDLHATMLHLMGIDHERLTYRFQGRDFRLTDIFGKVVSGILA
jgi:hypothetical protein